jgi:hypothetical protein
MGEIRELISTNTPLISAGNWERNSALGWRWETNVAINDKNALSMIKGYQRRYGCDSVATGEYFNDIAMKPTSTPMWFAIYVNDVETQVLELNRELENLESISAWLSKETR